MINLEYHYIYNGYKSIKQKKKGFFPPMEFCFQDGVFKVESFIIKELHALYLSSNKEIFQVLA
jgi:hypothetical protein